MKYHIIYMTLFKFCNVLIFDDNDLLIKVFKYFFEVSCKILISGKWTNAKNEKDSTTNDDSLSRPVDEMMITSYLQIREFVYLNMNFKHSSKKECDNS